MSGVTTMPEWQALEAHAKATQPCRIASFFEEDPKRSARYTVHLDDLSVDYSCQAVTEHTLSLLRAWAHKSQLPTALQTLFTTNQLNATERRAVWHPMLRCANTDIPHALPPEVIQSIQNNLQQMKRLCHEVRSGVYQSREVNHVIHIGIGGSDLGVRTVLKALAHYVRPDISIDFLSNLDPWELSRTLSELDPTKTLVIIASKSFTTYETLYNARKVVAWLGGKEKVADQCIALTANQDAAVAFGVSLSHVFPLWDWVGGRYSIWSSIGLTVAIGIGFEAFEAFLEGAALVDKHVLSASLQDNLPLQLALIDCWNINFLGAETRAVIPYAEKLNLFVPYIQQLIMESNGKSTDKDGNTISYHTGPIIWGGIGCHSQHAFHQLLMQGTQRVAIDFIYIAQADDIAHQEMQHHLNHQLFAQSKALLQGNQAKQPCQHRLIRGNVPHCLIRLEQLTPRALGMLFALYEYRTFLTACLWRINPFDQFGVELGKELALES